MGAWLGDSSPDALDRADLEPMSDESVQRDPPRDDVAARLLPRQIERIEHFRLDQRQLIPTTLSAERSTAVVVPISRQPSSGDCVDLLNASERELGVGRRE